MLKLKREANHQEFFDKTVRLDLIAVYELLKRFKKVQPPGYLTSGKSKT